MSKKESHKRTKINSIKITSILYKHPRVFLFALFFCASATTIVQLKIGLHIFCKLDASSGNYIIYKDENPSTCPVSKKENKYFIKAFNLETDMLCYGTFTILDTLSRNAPFFLSHWLLPSVQFQRTCVALPPPKKRISFSKDIITSIHAIFTKKKKGAGSARNASQNNWTKDASSPLELKLSSKQNKLIHLMRDNFQKNLSKETRGESFIERMNKVRWGGNDKGSFSWWIPDGKNGGARLLASYLMIMKWPDNLVSFFPANGLCTKGCPIDFALSHTLEFREKFKPWMITPSSYHENKNGVIYVHGYSCTQYHSDASKAGSSLAWYTPARRGSNTKDYEGHIRAVINAIDTCVADSFSRTGGKVGKCNIVLDFENFGISMVPPIAVIKKLLKMLQNHFPNRLGVLVIMNMATAGQMIVKAATPFIPDVVRRKIHVIPNVKDIQFEMLKDLVDEKFIPIRFGGTDNFAFDPKAYYESGNYQSEMWSENEGRAYEKSMPYHA